MLIRIAEYTLKNLMKPGVEFAMATRHIHTACQVIMFSDIVFYVLHIKVYYCYYNAIYSNVSYEWTQYGNGTWMRRRIACLMVVCFLQTRTLTKCLLNIGPSSATLAQHSTSIGLPSHFDWVRSRFSSDNVQSGAAVTALWTNHQ